MSSVHAESTHPRHVLALAAARRSIPWIAAAVVLVLVAFRFVVLVRDTPGELAFDFRQFWQGARDVVDGVSPYPSGELLATAGDHLTSVGIQEVFRFPYPAGAAVALAPFGALGFEPAAAIWLTVGLACVVATLRVLGVRDWRVHGVALTSLPVLSAVYLGTLTPVLLLLAAVVWRWRDRSVVAGAALALAIALKLFLWPLVLWLAATRRYAAAALAAGLALAFTLGSWAAIGFAGLAGYPEQLRLLTEVVAERGYSLVALGHALALPDVPSRLLPWAIGLALLGCALVLAHRREEDERFGFSLAVVAAIALTPIVWLHSFAFLAVPLALARPRIAWAWGLLWVFWVVPAQESDGSLWRLALALGVAAAVVVSVWQAAKRRSAGLLPRPTLSGPVA
jgi:hypothetical protein